MTNAVDFLLDFFSKFDEGRIFLPFGYRVWKIHTKGRPLSLWFGEVRSGNLPVCQGGINMYGYTLEDDGFVLYADVQSDSVELEWQVDLAPKV